MLWANTHKINRILIIIATLYIASFFVYSVFLVPRPYYIQSTDIENGYYYDARLIYHDLPTRTVTHPATPLFYIYSKFFIFTGDDISSTQEFLRTIYFAQALLNILVLIIFILILSKEYHLLVNLFILSLILASPSFLTYQDYIGADATIIIFGLPLLLLAWTLAGKEKKNIWLIILAFIYFGFAFAVKFSFLLLIVPAYIALLISSYFWKDWRGLKILLICPALSIASFLFFISRIIYRLPAIINQIIGRGMTDVGGMGELIERLYFNFKYLIFNMPVYFLTILFASISFLFLVSVYISRLMRKGENFSDEDRKIIPLSMFAFFGIIAFAYTLIASGNIPLGVANGDEPGVALRNMAPVLLLFPFLVLVSLEIIKRLGSSLNKNVYYIFVLLSVLIISESVINHVSYRNNMIHSNLERMARTEERLRSYIPKGTRFAIWSTDAKYSFGEASFHYWGNHKYGWNSFDEDLIDYFKDITFFQFRVAGQLVGQERFDSIDRNYPLPSILQKYPALATLYSKWREKFPPPKETDNIITGEGLGENPKIIMFPEAERELLQKDDAKLIELFKYRFGYEFTRKIANIEGRDWTIFSAAD